MFENLLSSLQMSKPAPYIKLETFGRVTTFPPLFESEDPRSNHLLPDAIQHPQTQGSTHCQEKEWKEGKDCFVLQMALYDQDAEA